MKRKIAAIVAADIAGYSRLVADDEEDTLRRLKGHRQVYDGLIGQYGGRIFNTAGDAVLSEFTSSVEAVRCAIDIQESLRRLNKAYQPTRHMNFRIGISVGDVVERDGDLLGDGVNIAARLEGLADPGGICISHSVYEQVANKLSMTFKDLGLRTVKNIPTPIHAYTLNLSDTGAALPAPEPAVKRVGMRQFKAVRMVAGAVFVAILGAGLYAFSMRDLPPVVATRDGSIDQSPPQISDITGVDQKTDTTLDPDGLPFISKGDQQAVQRIYSPAADYKAIALTLSGTIGMATALQSQDEAIAAALEACKAKAAGPSCFVYVVGMQVVNKTGRPPVPEKPWINNDPSAHQQFDADRLPFLSTKNQERLRTSYEKYLPPKAVAISSAGHWSLYSQEPSVEEAMRRALESCGARAGAACRIMAANDKIVQQIPTGHQIVSYFDAWNTPEVAIAERAILAARIAIAQKGWSAVAVGATKLPGLMVDAATEIQATDGALAACAKVDHDCKLLAIGPFKVAPK